MIATHIHTVVKKVQSSHKEEENRYKNKLWFVRGCLFYEFALACQGLKAVRLRLSLLWQILNG